MISPPGLLFLILDALLLGAVVLKPFHRTYDDSDKGDGPLVVLPPPYKPSYKRCGLFIGVSFAVSFFLVGAANPSAEQVYQGLVSQLLSSVVRNPTMLEKFAHLLPPVFPISILAFGVAFAIAFRAPLGRRLMILLNSLLFLLVSAVVEAFFGLFMMTTRFPLGPTPIVTLLIQYLLAGVVMSRLALTSFQLPKKTPFPLLRRGDLRYDIILIICILASLTICSGIAIWLMQLVGNDMLMATLVAFTIPSYFFLFITLFLGIIRLFGPRHPNPTDERPPLEVIIPAFNEEICIGPLLDSLDAAAAVYGGSVRVILCDDGSTDRTREIATETIMRFRSAVGEIINGAHTGKSGALNQALAACRADIVYRIDADCLVHPECFKYSVPHFLADPKVGLVTAFTLPKEPFTTWYDRQRYFEMIVGFGFVRPSDDLVDGIACVPGTFTAFRREPAMSIGGFVEGMYGEDLDFTLAMTRLGYRVAADTRVRSYEDVPNTQRQLRIQRTRWNRGATMAFARYAPYVTGFAGPRFWFFANRAAFKRFMVPVHLTTLAYVITAAIMMPSIHINLARLGILLLMKMGPAPIQLILACIYYRRPGRLAWLPLRYPFGMLKHYYVLESMLGFNARPVVAPRLIEALRAGQPPTALNPVDA